MGRPKTVVACTLALALACGREAPRGPAKDVGDVPEATAEGAAPEATGENVPAEPEPEVVPPTAAERDAALARAEAAPALFEDRPGSEASAVAASAASAAPAEIVPQTWVGGRIDFALDGRVALLQGPGGVALADLSTGLVRGTLHLLHDETDSAERVSALAIDPAGRFGYVTLRSNGRYCCAGTRVVAWNLGDGSRRMIFEARDRHGVASLHPNGSRVAVALGPPIVYEDGEGPHETDGTLTLLTPTGREVASRPLAGMTYPTVSFSPDGATVVVHDEQVGLELARADDLASIAQVMVRGREAPRFHPGGGALASVSTEGDLVEIRATDDGRVLRAIEAEPGEGGRLVDARWTDDGDRLIVRARERVRVFHGRSLEPLWAHRAVAVARRNAGATEAWSSDGEERLSLSSDRLIRRDGRTGTLTRSIPVDPGDATRRAVRLIPGGEEAVILADSAQIVSLADGTTRPLGGALHADPVDAARWYGPDRLALSGVALPRSTLSLWTPAGASSSACTEAVYPVDFAWENDLLWSRDGPAMMLTRNRNTGSSSLCVHGRDPSFTELPEAWALADGRWLIAQDDEGVALYTPRSLERPSHIALEDGERLVAWADDGRTVVVGGDFHVRALRRPGGSLLCRLALEEIYTDASMSPDGSVLALRNGAERRAIPIGEDCAIGLRTEDALTLLAGGRVLEHGERRMRLRAGDDLAVRWETTARSPDRVRVRGDDTVALVESGRVRVLALEDAAERRRTAELDGVGIDPTGRFADGCTGEAHVVVDLDSGETHRTGSCLRGRRDVSPDGRWVASPEGDRVRLRRVSDGLEAILMPGRLDGAWAPIVTASDGRFDVPATRDEVVAARAAGPMSTAPIEPGSRSPRRTPTLLREVLGSP